jgi:hypothetical protein
VPCLETETGGAGEAKCLETEARRGRDCSGIFGVAPKKFRKTKRDCYCVAHHEFLW